MKKRLLLASAIACSLGAMAQVPSLTWTKLIDSSKADTPNTLVESSDGNIIVYCNFGSMTENAAVSYDGIEVGYGCATDANSENLNALIMKIEPDGNKLWSVYSNTGDFESASSSIAPTHDGGAIVALKMRYAGSYSDKYPSFIDATGSRWATDNWNTGYRVLYILLLKIDNNGEIQWLKKIDVDVSPQENATTYSQGTPNSVYAYALAVDDYNNIYLAGNYRKTLIFSNSKNGSITLTPHNTEGWNGDSQNTVGDIFLVKLDSNGNYIKHLTTKGIDTREQITNLVYDSGKIYFTGNIQAATENTPITIGSKTVTPSLLDDILIGCADTTLNVSWATTITAYGASDNKHTTQIKNLELIDGNLYVMGLVKGGFGPSGSTAASIASAGSPLEGYVIKCDANDGSWIGGAVNGKSIGGYFGMVKNENDLYLYGYKLGTIFLDKYDETTWEKTTAYDLITGGGSSTAWSSLYLGNSLYTFSRCNSTTPSQYYNSEITTQSNGWGNVIACWKLFDDLPSGAEATAADTETHIYGVEGGVKIVTTDTTKIKIYNTVGQEIYDGEAVSGTNFIALPQGIYIVNDSKVIIR